MGDKRDVKIVCGPGRTKQSEKAACDINSIVARYRKTGFVEHFAGKKPVYGDFVNAPTYHAAQTAIARASGYFGQLPAAIRGRFENDPGKLCAFLDDPKNREEAIALGLVVEKAPGSDNAPVDGGKPKERPAGASTEASTPAPAAPPAA